MRVGLLALAVAAAGCGAGPGSKEEVSVAVSALTNGPVQLIVQSSHKCLDIVSGMAEQETCSTGVATQSWTMQSVTGGYRIVSTANPAVCLNIPGASTKLGALAAASTCSPGGVAGEIWTPTTLGGNYELIAAFDKLCLDISGASTANGAAALQWTCSSQQNQRWAIVALPVPDAGSGSSSGGSTDAGGSSSSSSSGGSTSSSTSSGGSSGSSSGSSSGGSSTSSSGGSSGTDGGSGLTFPLSAPVTLVAQNSGKCVDISSGTPVQEVCAGTSTQKWSFVPVGGGYQIASVSNPSMCLLIANGSLTAGQNAAVAACSSGGAPGDVWSPQAAGNNYSLVNGASSQCLDVGGASSNNGATLDQWTCDGASNQAFAISAPPAPPPPANVPTGSPFTLVVQHSGKCMDVSSGGAVQNTCSGATSQEWTFKAVTGGYQILSLANPATCINVPGASTSPGQSLSVSTCSSGGTPGEVWSPQAQTGGLYELVNLNSTLCADVANASGSDGATVLQWTCLAQTNQLWAFNAVTVSPDAGVDAGGPGSPDATAPDAGSLPEAAPPDAAADVGAPPADAGSVVDAPAGTVPTTSTVQIQAQNSGLCIDIVSGTAEQEACSHSTTQGWSFKSVAGGVQIVSAANPASCLLIPGGSKVNSAAAAVSACSANGAPGDTWTASQVGNDFAFANTTSGQCLDVNGGSGSAGAILDQWPCNGASNQTFAFVYPPTPATVPVGSAITIASVNGGNCLDFNEGAGLQEPCWGAGSQQWAFKAVTGGYQIVTAGNQSQCVTMAGGSTTPGQTVMVATCSSGGAPGEVWTPIASGSHVALMNNSSGQCLDVNAASTSAGAAVDQWTCDGATNQAWIVTVSGSLPNPRVDGQWSPIYDTQSIAVAAAMMPNGKVMTWASWTPTDWVRTNGLNQTYTTIVDPATLTSTEVLVTQTSHDMFCPGTAMLSDGRLLVNGGGPDTANTSIYDGSANTWSSDAVMNEGRWYDVSVTLPSGQVFTLGGNRLSGLDGTGEIWTQGSGWSFVPNALMAPLMTGTNESNRAQEHPRLFVAPNGKVFIPGPNPNMYWYDLTGSGTVTSAGLRGDDVFSQNDATVLFDVGKILKAGGNTNYGWDQGGYSSTTTASSPNAYVIDINGGGNAQVTKVAPLAHKRAFATPVVLPAGTVMVSGGLDNGATFTDVGAVFPPELYSPSTQTWRDLPPVWVPRTYHSVAVLLPDGRVFVGGGGLCGTGCQYNHSNYQMYSPAYLFQAGRPAITSAPSSASWGKTFSVATTGTVTGFTWVRMSSTTHTVNTDQRWMAAQSSGSGGSFTVTAPANGNVAPPGYYMLFALNGGVPSVAAIVKIGP